MVLAVCSFYASSVAEALNPDGLTLIRRRLQRQHALGADRFRTMIEIQLLRRAAPAKIGRPSKARSVSWSGTESALYSLFLAPNVLSQWRQKQRLTNVGRNLVQLQNRKIIATIVQTMRGNEALIIFEDKT